MSFTGEENHEISLAQASTWTKDYRDLDPKATKGHFFGKNAIQNILNQTDCVGIRIYYGLDGDGAKQLIISGATANEDDLYEGLLAERSRPSPPFGGANNPLNS